tara:strand:- start:2751 stop:3491 length:741 start_codon:yes stop_codon:yes gene_type:complete
MPSKKKKESKKRVPKKKASKKILATKQPPLETSSLRRELAKFLDQKIKDPQLGTIRVGNYKWGVYAFYDYDEEPIYVGQTYELLRTRIRRHLTNQRTDAVAMNVLDPHEVHTIKVWPLAQFQELSTKEKEEFASAKDVLNALERWVYDESIRESKFGKVLNEKKPPPATVEIDVPSPVAGVVVSEQVFALRSHPDVRLARRSQILARLAQVIEERRVAGGLRQVLVVQAERLLWLAQQRLTATTKT